MAENATTTDERSMRRARRQALIDAGVNPYPIASEVTAHAAELEERYASLADGEDTEDVVSVAGRIRALRKQGKAAFIVLEDVTGSIQLFCRHHPALLPPRRARRRGLGASCQPRPW